MAPVFSQYNMLLFHFEIHYVNDILTLQGPYQDLLPSLRYLIVVNIMVASPSQAMRVFRLD
jgi:hypothetical protein